MLITRTSTLTGIKRTRSIDVKDEDLERFNKGFLLQNAFPYLSANDREFIKSGITPEEWDEHFPEEDD